MAFHLDDFDFQHGLRIPHRRPRCHTSQNVQTIAIPAFVNRTQTYKIEQRLTSAVFVKWSRVPSYHILNDASDSADAT